MTNTMRTTGRATTLGLGLALLTHLAPVAARAQQPAPTATIIGVVYDSLRAVGLPRAIVRVRGTTRQAVSNDRGGFVLDSLAPGEMAIDVRHPLLDTLGQELFSPTFKVESGQRAAMTVRTITLEELRAKSCPRGGVNSQPGILLGIVRDADADTALAGGTAQLVYKDQFAGNATERVRSARIGADGRFIICGLPDAVTGSLQVSRSGHLSPEVRVETKGTLFTTFGATFGTGTEKKASLSGRVVQQAGLPVPGAQVVVAGSPNVAVTDSAGRYRLDGLPSGTAEVVARRIGLASLTQTVNLRQRAPATLDFKLSDVQTLAAVKVVGKLDNGLEKSGYNERLNRGMGKFIGPQEIADRKPAVFTDLLRTMPGVKVSQTGQGTVIESTRSGGCLNIFVDNARFQSYSPGDVDGAFSATNVGAVEVYTSASETPMEFVVPGRSCGAIVMWTRERLSRP